MSRSELPSASARGRDPTICSSPTGGDAIGLPVAPASGVGYEVGLGIGGTVVGVAGTGVGGLTAGGGVEPSETTMISACAPQEGVAGRGGG